MLFYKKEQPIAGKRMRGFARKSLAILLSCVLSGGLCLPVTAADISEQTTEIEQSETVDEVVTEDFSEEISEEPAGDDQQADPSDTTVVSDGSDQESVDENTDEGQNDADAADSSSAVSVPMDPAEADSNGEEAGNDEAGNTETDTTYTEIVTGEPEGVPAAYDQVGQTSEWLIDYSYSVDPDEGVVYLDGYNGADLDVVVPGSAYVAVGEYSQEYNKIKINSTGMWPNAVSITFESGVIFPESSHYMFSGNQRLEQVDLTRVDFSNVTDMSYMFQGCSNLQSVSLSSCNFSNVTDISYMFQDCSNLQSVSLSGCNISNVTNVAGMFENCRSLQTVDLSGCGLSGVTEMYYMFRNCSELTNINLTGVQNSVVNAMGEAFYGCSSLNELDLSGFDLSNLSSYGSIFEGCNNLARIYTPANLNADCYERLPTVYVDINGEQYYSLPTGSGSIELNRLEMSEWLSDYEFVRSGDVLKLTSYHGDAAEVTVPGSAVIEDVEYTYIVLSPGMWPSYYGPDGSVHGVTKLSFESGVYLPQDSSRLFADMPTLESIDLTNVSSHGILLDISYMFSQCTSLREVNLGDLDVSGVYDMSGMFENCTSLETIDLSNMNLENASGYGWMFSDAENLKTIQTPYGNTNAIYLPDAYTDVNNNIYTLIPEGSESLSLEKAEYSEWLSDYDFEVSGDKIRLTGYHGKETEVTVPGSAVISGVEYARIELSSRIWGPFYSPDGETEGVTKLSFESGVYLPEDASWLFGGLSTLESVDLSNVSSPDGLSNLSRMFVNCTSLREVNLGDLDVSGVYDMGYMFEGCTSLETIDLSNMNLENASGYEYMFSGAFNLKTIQTPYGNTNVIDLPGAYVDVDNNVYTSIPEVGESISLNKAEYSEWLHDYTFELDGDSIILMNCIGNYDEPQDLTVPGTAEVNGKQFNAVLLSSSIWFNASSWVQSLTFGSGVRFPKNCSYMFEGLSNLTVIDMSSADTSEVENMNNMFRGCSSLESLDLSNFVIGMDTEVTDMFEGCNALQTLTVPATNLSGEVPAGPELPSPFVDSEGNVFTRMPMDLSADTVLTRAEYSEWLKDYNFDIQNDMIVLKKYLGSDEEVTVPGSAEVSGTEYHKVTFGKYVWNNGTVRSLSFEDGVVLPVSCYELFAHYYYTLTDVDLSHADTSAVVSMDHMFGWSYALRSVTFGSNDFSNVARMDEMFAGCNSLESVSLEDVKDCSPVDVFGMFRGCSSLKTIDLSSFDLSGVSETDDVFEYCDALEHIVTPVGVQVGIDLPAPFVDADGNIMVSLPLNQTESTELNRAEVSEWLKDYDYDYADNTIELRKYHGESISNLVVPGHATIGSKEITRIRLTGEDIEEDDYWDGGIWENERRDITSVTLEEGVIFPADSRYMFADMENMTSLDLSKADVSGIVSAQDMFKMCHSLQEIQTPKGLAIDVLLPGAYQDENGNVYFELPKGQETSMTLTPVPAAEVSEWLRNFNYSVVDDTILLGTYVGTEKNLTVPASAVIAGTTFNKIQLTESTFRSEYYSTEKGPDIIQTLAFEDGVLLPQDCDGLFYGLSELTSFDGSNLDTSRVTNMSYMFSYCTFLESLDLNGWDTSRVTNMYGMFEDCHSLTSLNIKNWNTSNVTDMNRMFAHCEALTSLDLKGWDTSKVTDMTRMFTYCESLMSLDLSSFNCANVQSRGYMFRGSKNLMVLEAPLEMQLKADLPAVYTGSDGFVYTSLPQNLAKSIRLTWTSLSGDAAGDPDQPSFTISESPADLLVASGTDVSFHVAAQGANLTYQWYQSPDRVKWEKCTDSSYVGADTDTLSFVMDSRFADYRYRCMVSNGTDSLFSDSAKLTLDSMFEITQQPVDQQVRAGETATFHVEGSGTNLTYQWQMSKDGENWSNCTSAGHDTDTFSFVMKASYSGRHYRCIVSDGIDSLVSDPAELTVRLAANIIRQPENVKVAAGETAEFSVEASGEDLTYQWQYSKNGTNWYNCTAAGANTDTFSFEMRSNYANRQYRCTISDGVDTVVSDSALLSLRIPLAITEQPVDSRTAAGDTASFHVTAVGENVTYQWQLSKDGVNWSNCTSKGYNTDTFSFTMKASYSGRHYRCVVGDGTDLLYTDVAELLLASSAGITLQPSDIEVAVGDQASFHVEAAGDNLSYQWQYSTTGTNWTNCTSKGYNTDTFSFTMKSGFNGRHYRCVIHSGQEEMISDAAQVSLKTAEGITSHPKDVQAALNEAVNFSVEATGSSLTYQWQYSKNGTSWTNCTSKGYNTNTFGFVMKSSFVGRQYRCVVTSDGQTWISNPATVSLKTASEITTQPSDVTAAAGDTVNLHIAAQGNNVSYQWQYSKNGTSWSNCTSAGYNSETFSFKMSSSFNGRKYRCVVTVDGKQVISDVATITMK